MRVATILLLGVLALIPSPSAANHVRKVDSLVFSIHVDLVSQYDIEDLRRVLEDARAMFQGSSGPADVACCTQIDAIDLEIFGTPGDGLDVIDSQAKQDQVISMNALVLDITWPTPRCGSAFIGRNGMTVASIAQLESRASSPTNAVTMQAWTTASMILANRSWGFPGGAA